MTPSELIHAVETADSSDALLDAVEALAEARSLQAIPTLIQVLGFNNPGAAVAAVDGLIEIGEPSVLPILQQLDGYNYGARAWAVRVLSGIGDPRGLEILLDSALTDFALSVRRAATRGLGTVQWDQLLPEQILPTQFRVFEVLLQTAQDSEWIVRYATVVSLQALGLSVRIIQPQWYEHLLQQLEQMMNTDETLAVCARAQLASQRLMKPA